MVSDLVSEIHDAGYFVEEVEGENRKITIEIEAGSVLPEEDFLENIVTDVQTYVEEAQMNSSIILEDEESKKDAEGYDAEAYEVEIPSADDKDTKETPEENDSSKETPPSEDDSQTTPPKSDNTGGNPGTTPTTPPKRDNTGNNPGTPSGGNTGNPPADTPSQPPVKQDSPYTDYESPYTDYESPYTDYDSHYDSPYGQSDYSDYYQ